MADAVGADRFAYYGYSWLALAGLQLAIRSDRLTALAMGGFAPLDGPYGPMLQVTTATHEMAMANATSPPSTEPSGEPAGEPDWSQVQVLEGLDHTQAMQAVHGLPILRPWLISSLGTSDSPGRTRPVS